MSIRGVAMPRSAGDAPGLRHALPVLALALAAVVTYLANDWLVLPAIGLLALGWRLLSREDGAPVVAAAFTYQWTQVTIAILYFALFRRRVPEMSQADYRPMILIGLAAIAAMFGGFYWTARLPKTRRRAAEIQFDLRPTLRQLGLLYAASVASSGVLEQFAWSIPRLTQVVLVLSLIRYVFLYMLVRRLARPKLRIGWLAAIMLGEVVLGFSGFFANFREPLFVIGIALLGSVNRRRVSTWLILAVIGAVGIGAAITWTAIKPIIRKNYVSQATSRERVGVALSLIGPALIANPGAWQAQADKLVSRMWTVYYPALAVARVPSVIPHENGAILMGAIEHLLTPRLFFPEKPELTSDSDKVRKYSGVWVGGREKRTSYAFGYAGESYVDFGIPLMFLPIFLYGAGMGVAHRRLRQSIRHPEIRAGVTVVLFWLSLYLFEVSWVMMLGTAITRLIVLGAGARIVDHLLLPRRPYNPVNYPVGSALPPLANQSGQTVARIP